MKPDHAPQALLDTIDADTMLREVQQWAAINTGTANIDGLKQMAGVLADAFSALPGDVELVDGIIYKELMLGRVTRSAERALKTIITNKAQEGAEAIVLASTELALVVDVDANVLPVFDSTRIHCEAAANWVLEQKVVN